jgi:pyruvate,orthophosphate dikinase
METLEQIPARSSATEEPPSGFSQKRSRASMPGMMDTILNLGMNEEVAESFAKITNNPRFAYDSYRRFIKCTPMLLWSRKKYLKSSSTR